MSVPRSSCYWEATRKARDPEVYPGAYEIGEAGGEVASRARFIPFPSGEQVALLGPPVRLCAQGKGFIPRRLLRKHDLAWRDPARPTC